jgi:uncharacterized protein (DUF433 family)
MGLSVDDIVAKFPNKTIPTIAEEPDYATINNMVEIVYGNAASLPTSLGGGSHGHISLLMTPALYDTLAPGTAYDAPADPGPVPVHAVGATATARESNALNHKELRRIFDNHHNMDAALKAQVIDTIQDTYIGELRNKYTGYLGVTTRDLLDHLLDRYGKITPADIVACKKEMTAPIDSTQPIDLDFKRIDDCIQYADDGQVPFTIDQILQTTYHAVSTSGYYSEACTEWHRCPPNQKTWALFKQFFAAEYHDLKEQQCLNVTQSNFHHANHAVELMADISTALDNLAMAATTDQDIVAQLTQANQALTAANWALTNQLQQALNTHATLVNSLQARHQPTAPTTLLPPTVPPTPNNPQRPGRPPFDRAAWVANLDPQGYCWSHGLCVQNGRNSTTCKGKLQGHQDNATRTDTKGGSNKGNT